MIRELIQAERLPVADALSLVTVNVAKALGLEESKGRLEVGFDADLLLMDEDLGLDTVIARGKVLMQGGKLQVQDTIMLD